MSTITTRQQPVATEFERQLDQLGSVAAAIADNAFEDGEAVDSATAWEWIERLDKIKNSVLISMTIAKSSGA
jgi:hypothetical protein